MKKEEWIGGGGCSDKRKEGKGMDGKAGRETVLVCKTNNQINNNKKKTTEQFKKQTPLENV